MDEPSANGGDVLRLASIDLDGARALLARYGLTLELVADDDAIPGSYWGESEAGVIGHRVYARRDTPVHSLLNEACLGLIGAKGPTIVEGPFAANRLYLTLLAALTGRPAIAVPGSTGTSQGASLLTGIAPVATPETRVEPSTMPGLEAYRAAWLAAIG